MRTPGRFGRLCRAWLPPPRLAAGRRRAGRRPRWPLLWHGHGASYSARRCSPCLPAPRRPARQRNEGGGAGHHVCLGPPGRRSILAPAAKELGLVRRRPDPPPVGVGAVTDVCARAALHGAFERRGHPGRERRSPTPIVNHKIHSSIVPLNTVGRSCSWRHRPRRAACSSKYGLPVGLFLGLHGRSDHRPRCRAARPSGRPRQRGRGGVRPSGRHGRRASSPSPSSGTPCSTPRERSAP